MTVIVIIANGHTMAVTLRQIGDAGCGAGIREGAVPLIVEKAIATALAVRIGRKRTTLDDIDVEPAVAVVIE